MARNQHLGMFVETLSEGGDDHVEQLPFADRLGKVCGNTQLPAAESVSPASDRRQHDDRRIGESRVFLDPLRQLESVHNGHLRIENYEWKSAFRVRRFAEDIEGLRTTVGMMWIHA